MENIEVFLKGANAYGVPLNSLFQTVDLFEGRNMAMVIATILQVGTEVSTQLYCPAVTHRDCYVTSQFLVRLNPVMATLSLCSHSTIHGK